MDDTRRQDGARREGRAGTQPQGRQGPREHGTAMSDLQQYLADPARGDLIEQRLEEVMVPAIDEHDVERCVAEPECRVQPAESSADDDHARALHAHLPGNTSRGASSPPSRGVR